MKGHEENLPGNGSDWQNKRFWISRILNEEQKRANEKHSYRNMQL